MLGLAVTEDDVRRHTIGEGARFSWVLGILLSAIVYLLSWQLSGLRMALPEAPTGEASKREPELYKVLSFGHLPSAVDWVWITTLAESELTRPPKGTHAQLFYDLDMVTDLDPLFSELYVAGANLLAVVQDDGTGAKVILDKGDTFRKQRLPDLPEHYRRNYWANPWQIPVLLAYTHLFELNDMPGAARHFREAAALPNVPPYVVKLQRRLESPGGEYEVGLKLLDFLINGENEPSVRQGLFKKRDNLLIAQFLFEMNLQWRKYKQAHKGKTSWSAFVAQAHALESDPWGGRLSLDANDKIVTTTPYVPVFGLD